MFNKIFLFVYFVGFSRAVFIDTSENHNKEIVTTNPQTWQMVKVYPPPSQLYGYKYEPYTYPKYEFEYSVSDKHTGDQKHHHEARDGDKVRGEYSLVESDGSLRKVEYHADDHNGFNAIVSKTVNKHGDHAISVSDHTRFFSPVGHNVKINHYFPGRDYHYQEPVRDVEQTGNAKINKPVHEEDLMVNSVGTKMVGIQSGNKLMLLEPIKFEEKVVESAQEASPSPKTDIAEDVPVQVVPASVSVVHQMPEINSSTESVTADEKSDVFSSKDSLSKSKEQSLDKEDQNDSDVASSYYHSKYYYISY